VTIPEGYTMFDIAKAMEDAGLGSSQDFMKIFRSRTDLISDLAPEAKSLEGYLFRTRISSPAPRVSKRW